MITPTVKRQGKTHASQERHTNGAVLGTQRAGWRLAQGWWDSGLGRVAVMVVVAEGAIEVRSHRVNIYIKS